MIDHTIYFDGATRESNPSDKIGYGVIIDGEEHMGSMYSCIGNLTNNLAEYHGFLLALRLIEHLEYEGTILIMGDSKLLIKQMTGEWKIKEGIYCSLARGCLNILKRLDHLDIRLKWIPREENKEADALSKKALLT